jgi:membrane protein DedA with SNARE-associated domain
MFVGRGPVKCVECGTCVLKFLHFIYAQVLGGYLWRLNGSYAGWFLYTEENRTCK